MNPLNVAAFRSLQEELNLHSMIVEVIRPNLARIRRSSTDPAPDYLGIVRVDRLVPAGSKRIRIQYTLYDDSGLVTRSESPVAIRFHLDGSLRPDHGGVR